MNPQQLQQGWYQLQASIPYVGQQLVAWLYTDQARAAALQLIFQSCPNGSAYRVLTQQGQPVISQQQGPQLPGWPQQSAPQSPGNYQSPGWPWPWPAA